ncbi:hypothetical protein ACH5RR_026258 [Cinchona calisaya]|uniref:Uncharacterized protein n=1 Tax=Cinchona calisaya TaxID=153742 RepID=A0ABD2Z2C4_9GENT
MNLTPQLGQPIVAIVDPQLDEEKFPKSRTEVILDLPDANQLSESLIDDDALVLRQKDQAQVYSRPTEAPLCPGNLLRERRGEVKEQARDGFYKFVNDMQQLDLHAGDSRAGRPASDVEEDDERQQALEAIKSSRNAEKNSSDAWRRMILIKDFSEARMIALVREGNISFWFDNWEGNGALLQGPTEDLKVLLKAYYQTYL